MAQQTQINGNRYSFVNISVQIGDTPIPKGVFRSLNYDCTQDPGVIQGNMVGIVGRTVGFGTATGSFEMLVSDFDDLNLALTGAGTFPTMSVDFNVQVSYSVNDIDVRTDSLLGCRITSISSANTQGTDATVKSCNLSIAKLVLNNIPAFGDPTA